MRRGEVEGVHLAAPDRRARRDTASGRLERDAGQFQSSSRAPVGGTVWERKARVGSPLGPDQQDARVEAAALVPLGCPDLFETVPRDTELRDQ